MPFVGNRNPHFTHFSKKTYRILANKICRNANTNQDKILEAQL